ncbi:hypothetical protein [Methylobacter luteus]|uniref:hypothetical protein n=1 Tax=Methylobacter luteus TaxID=415 RepID=UPI0012DC7F78|nr:hypothetical protein [Methylobacter luteus]
MESSPKGNKGGGLTPSSATTGADGIASVNFTPYKMDNIVHLLLLKSVLIKYQLEWLSNDMKEKYKAAFIIPVDTQKTLGEDGWEFETSKRLSSELSVFLADALNLRFLESYADSGIYMNDNIKMTITYDPNKLIEFVYFQLVGDALSTLKTVFARDIFENSELFIP